MRVVTVPVLEDNYAYLLIAANGKAAAVDPADADKVVEAARKEGAEITLCLTTHRHQDHAGGNLRLTELCPDVEIVGGAEEPIPCCTKKVQDEDTLALGDIHIRCLRTPFHTADHICYLASPVPASDRHESVVGSPPALFSGDTLFVGGCGRCFMGHPRRMHASLARLRDHLPAATLIYSGHEYAVKNLQFAAIAEPENMAVKAKLAWALEQRSAGKPTVPSRLEEELTYNPFLRWECASVRMFTSKEDPVEVLAELRRLKDHSTWDSSMVTHVINAVNTITWPMRRMGLLAPHWP